MNQGHKTGLIIHPGYEHALRADGLDSLPALFDLADAELLAKPGLSEWRQRLRLRLNVNGVETVCYLKRFQNPPRSARREVRRSACGAKSVAGLEWHWATRLAADGIPCIEPIAFGEELNGRREIRSAILTRAVPGASLEQWMERWGPQDRQTIQRLIPELASLVSRLHGCGYVHRDLYLSHVFFDPDGTPCLHLIDLQRVMRPTFRPKRWMVKDLAALNASTPPRLVSRSDRLRWLKLFMGIRKLDSVAKCLALRIMGKSAAIQRHDFRRRARLD